MLLPESAEFGDYALSLHEILEATQEIENRSQVEILRDMQVLFADIIRLRHFSVGSADGSIPLEAGMHFVQGARGLLLAAASAAITPRNYFPNRLAEATEYIKKTRLGQTEKGSFVVTIVSPIFVSGNLFSERPDEPFERRVTTTLARAVAAAAAAADASDKLHDIKPFRDAVRLGVSSNLCDSLVAIHEETNATDVGVSLSWAPGRELPKPDVPENIIVSQKIIPVLREASRFLREEFSPHPAELFGSVTDLHSDWMLHAKSPDTAGEITVDGKVDRRKRKVRVTLLMSDYLRAVDAHRKGSRVRIKGEIRRDGNFFSLIDPYDFEVVD